MDILSFNEMKEECRLQNGGFLLRPWKLMLRRMLSRLKGINSLPVQPYVEDYCMRYQW